MSAKRKQRSVTEDGEEARRQWAVPKRSGTVKGIDLAYLNRADLNDRRRLIAAEHPEYQNALENGVHELVIDGQPVNPYLHIALHEVVANQLWEGPRRRCGRLRNGSFVADIAGTTSFTCSASSPPRRSGRP